MAIRITGTIIGVISSTCTARAMRKRDAARPYAAIVPSRVATTEVSAAALNDVAVACRQDADAK